MTLQQTVKKIIVVKYVILKYIMKQKTIIRVENKGYMKIGKEEVSKVI
jgi:hypothetical protein